MSRLFYSLDDKGEPVSHSDILAWAEAQLDGCHALWSRVGYTVFGDAKLTVSTVFFPFQMNWPGASGAVVWETAIITRNDLRVIDRCAGDRAQARAMHARCVADVRARILASGGNAEEAEPKENQLQLHP